ncbi:MFS domain-containing protein [Mycena venus]|uniref:MFS domain-containing protein n=1 Tax=Mycena venus TaxID=2733690 RepID=A0A8H6XBR7_9AGAR|nr:MFS domain-containing protein [Mycena venus]
MSTSRSSSRVSARHQPGRSVSYLQSALPDGPVDEETAELLGGLVNPHHEQDDTLVDEAAGEDSQLDRERRHLPWWKRPSPWWLMLCTPLSTISMSATIAPKLEIYNLLAFSPAFLPLLPNSHPEPMVTTFPPSFDIATNTAASPPVSSISKMPDYPTKECSSDPVVMAAVAKLTATLTTSMGVLGCLTAGWWGAFSDRFGRTRILALTVFGLLINDLTFIFVTRNFQIIPGGYWFLVVGPIVEGALGGVGAGSAASHAYISDTTLPSERSRYFSILLGLIFTGIGLGPSIGGILVRYAGLLSVFYLAAAVHGAFALLCLVVLPESLTKTQMQAASALYRESLRLLDEQEKTWLVRIQRLFVFLKPLTIFFPELNGRGQNGHSGSLKGRKWDWNLSLASLAYGFVISIMGSLSYKFQYAMAFFNWNSETLGYLLTATGAIRAVFLAILLPLGIKVAKRVSKRSRPSGSELDPLLSRATSQEPHSASFDLSLARISLFIEIIAYGAMPLASTGAAFFGFTILSSFGAGFNPAVQSAALELYSKRIGTGVEAGKLFGGMSVIQALAGQILGPSIYGLIFIKTVATFPKAIFIVSVASVFISTDAEEEVSHIPEHGVRDATLVEVGDSAGSGSDNLRGRKKDASVVVPVVTVSAPSP